MPLGAIISKESIMDWPPGAHASTFGGNPVACAAAIETIKQVQNGLMDNAAEQGLTLKGGLSELKAKYDFIRDVRGLGLMVAFEIGDDKSPDQAIALRNEIIQRAFQKGMLLLGCGVKSIRLSPALSITKEEVDVALGILGQVFEEIKI
jgi:4-aminobutyrate aminotransferase